MPELIQGLLAVSFTVAVVMLIARADFRKRVREGSDTIEETNANKRKLKRINLTLAASVFIFLASFAAPSGESDQTSEQPVVAETSDETLPEGVYGPGTYKVGADIPAGEYKLTATESDYRGYYEVKDDMSSDGGILSNSLFDGTEYVEVRTGEYLSVTRATFTLVAQSATSEAKPDKEDADEPEVVEKSVAEEIPYAFMDPQQEAEFFKAIYLTIEYGRETMQEVSAMSRMCGKVCPDVPGDDWGLQLEPMNKDAFALQRNLHDLARDLKSVPDGGSPNIDFAARDELVREMETTVELITIIMTKLDWATWQDGWDTVDEANRLMDRMYETDVYTVPQ